MDFDAFISYATADKTVADAACAVLEAAGIRCWVAPRDISPGREYAAEIPALPWGLSASRRQSTVLWPIAAVEIAIVA
jgi:hypothetical protein